MSKENTPVTPYISNTTNATIKKAIKEMIKRDNCPICHVDCNNFNYKQKKDHARGHLILCVCDCGYYHSRDYVVRLHSKKAHPGMPIIIHRVDRDNWYKLTATISRLPKSMPALPWEPAKEEDISDSEVHEVPDITIILKEMTNNKKKLSPIKDLREKLTPLNNISMELPPRIMTVCRQAPMAYFTAQYRKRKSLEF